MLTHAFTRPNAPRRGFTITELPVALAFLVFIMFIANEGFTTGLETYRKLRGVDDLNEQLRDDAARLHRDLDAANTATAAFIFDRLRAETTGRDDAQALRKRYEAIASSADDLNTRLEEVERRTDNAAAKRTLRRTRGYLEQIKLAATCAADLLELIERDDG